MTYYIVRYQPKNGVHSLYQGPPGYCNNGAGFRPSRSACFRKNAVRFAFIGDAEDAAEDCNDKWEGFVEEADAECQGYIRIDSDDDPHTCPECGVEAEEDYVTGETHPFFLKEDGEPGLECLQDIFCSRCCHRDILKREAERRQRR